MLYFEAMHSPIFYQPVQYIFEELRDETVGVLNRAVGMGRRVGVSGLFYLFKEGSNDQLRRLQQQDGTNTAAVLTLTLRQSDQFSNKW